MTRRYRPSLGRYRPSPRFLTCYTGPYSAERTVELARFVAARRDRLLVVRNGERLRRVLGIFPWMQRRVLVHAELYEGKHLAGGFNEMAIDEAAHLDPLLFDTLQRLSAPKLVLYAAGTPAPEGDA